MNTPLQARIADTRTELGATLDAIEDRVNPRKQLLRLGRKAQLAYDANPVPFILAAAGAVAVVGGLIAWAVLGDD